MTIYFKRIYDFSEFFALADLFKKFAINILFEVDEDPKSKAEHIAAKKAIDDEFKLFASSNLEFCKKYGGHGAVLMANLALCDIFQDGAVIKIPKKSSVATKTKEKEQQKEYEFFSLRQFDKERFDIHLKSAQQKLDEAQREARRFSAAESEKRVAVECAIDYLSCIEAYASIVDFLEGSEEIIHFLEEPSSASFAAIAAAEPKNPNTLAAVLKTNMPKYPVADGVGILDGITMGNLTAYLREIERITPLKKEFSALPADIEKILTDLIEDADDLFAFLENGDYGGFLRLLKEKQDTKGYKSFLKDANFLVFIRHNPKFIRFFLDSPEDFFFLEDPKVMEDARSRIIFDMMLEKIANLTLEKVKSKMSKKQIFDDQVLEAITILVYEKKFDHIILLGIADKYAKESFVKENSGIKDAKGYQAKQEQEHNKNLHAIGIKNFDHAQELMKQGHGSIKEVSELVEAFIKPFTIAANGKNSPLIAKRDAMCYLAAIYLKGIEYQGKILIAANVASAIKYFADSAELGLVPAKLDAGSLYRTRGDAEYAAVVNALMSHDKMMQFYKEAASCDNVDALVVLALAFQIGEKEPLKVVSEYELFLNEYHAFNAKALDSKSKKVGDASFDTQPLNPRPEKVEVTGILEGIFVKQNLAKAKYYWGRLLEIIPKEASSIRKKINKKITEIDEAISIKKKEDKNPAAAKAQSVAKIEESFDKKIKRLIKEYNKTPDEIALKSLQKTMFGFFLIDDRDEFYDQTMQQIGTIAANSHDVIGLGKEAKIIINIKACLKKEEDRGDQKKFEKRAQEAKKILLDLSKYIDEENEKQKSANDSIDSKFWKKAKSFVDELKLQQEILLANATRSLEAPSSAASAIAVQDSGLALSKLKPPSTSKLSASSLAAPVIAKEVAIQDKQSKEDKEFEQLIKDYREDPVKKERALQDFIINLFFRAIENKFSDQASQKISSFFGSISQSAPDKSGSETEIPSNDLITKIKVIVKIKTALFSSDKAKRDKALSYLIEHYEDIEKSLKESFAPVDQKSASHGPDLLDRLFWEKVKKVVDKIQMDCFLEASLPLKFSKDLPVVLQKPFGDFPIFLQEIFNKIHQQGHRVFLKGSFVNRSVDSKRIPVDIDMDVLVRGLYDKSEEEIRAFAREIFGCEVLSIFKSTRGAKTISVNLENKDLRVEFSLYDQELGSIKETSWSNSKDAIRVEIGRANEAIIDYVDGFKEYLKSAAFDPEVDFALNPSGRNAILRSCFLVAIGEVKEQKLLQSLSEQSFAIGLRDSLHEEMQSAKNLTAEGMAKKIKEIVAKHCLGDESQKIFFSCLEKIYQLIPQATNSYEERQMSNIKQAIENAKNDSPESTIKHQTANSISEDRAMGRY